MACCTMQFVFPASSHGLFAVIIFSIHASTFAQKAALKGEHIFFQMHVTIGHTLGCNPTIFYSCRLYLVAILSLFFTPPNGGSVERASVKMKLGCFVPHIFFMDLLTDRLMNCN